ncbi:MAG: cytochrome c [Gemmatimonadaceae bacterium]|nr:cytochrome c [Gemmatimonadaceae bacterium]
MHRTTFFQSAFLAAVVGASVIAGSSMTAQHPAAPITVWGLAQGQDTVPKVYTDSQATAGQAVWTKNCTECHETSDVTGADFRTKWVGQSLFSLYETIRTTMPDGNPGTLSTDEYASTVAYILKLNGLPSGDVRLATDSVTLSAITFRLPAASGTENTQNSSASHY